MGEVRVVTDDDLDLRRLTLCLGKKWKNFLFLTQVFYVSFLFVSVGFDVIWLVDGVISYLWGWRLHHVSVQFDWHPGSLVARWAPWVLYRVPRVVLQQYFWYLLRLLWPHCLIKKKIGVPALVKILRVLRPQLLKQYDAKMTGCLLTSHK